MFEYLLEKADKLGDYDEKFGQRYWCKAQGVDLPLSFNSQRQDIKAGDLIQAEESVNKRSAKGTDYLQLRKVKPVFGQPASGQPASAPSSALSSTPSSAQPRTGGDELLATVKRIEAKLDRLLGDEVTTATFDPQASARARTQATDPARQAHDEYAAEMPDDFLQ